MESLSKLVAALASVAWPAAFIILIFRLYDPIRRLVDSANQRKFTIKVAGNELTMEEASQQQASLLSNIQSKLAELEKKLGVVTPLAIPSEPTPTVNNKRFLWVDDKPKNNSYLVASLEEKGARVDIALTTHEGIDKFRSTTYDAVISDMGRPEGERARIDLANKIRKLNKSIPIFIYCGGWAARNLRNPALASGVNDITSSGTTLLRHLLSQ
jgi:CheY-like chemotaxis protein